MKQNFTESYGASLQIPSLVLFLLAVFHLNHWTLHQSFYQYYFGKEMTGIVRKKETKKEEKSVKHYITFDFEYNKKLYHRQERVMPYFFNQCHINRPVKLYYGDSSPDTVTTGHYGNYDQQFEVAMVLDILTPLGILWFLRNSLRRAAAKKLFKNLTLTFNGEVQPSEYRAGDTIHLKLEGILDKPISIEKIQGTFAFIFTYRNHAIRIFKQEFQLLEKPKDYMAEDTIRGEYTIQVPANAWSTIKQGWVKNYQANWLVLLEMKAGPYNLDKTFPLNVAGKEFTFTPELKEKCRGEYGIKTKCAIMAAGLVIAAFCFFSAHYMLPNVGMIGRGIVTGFGILVGGPIIAYGFFGKEDITPAVIQPELARPLESDASKP